MRQTVIRAAGPGVATLLLTGVAVAFVTRFILERVSLDGLVLNLILRNRDPYLGMPLIDAVAVAMARSLALIVFATTLASVVGFMLAVLHFAARHRLVRAIAWSVGTVGVSLPSFFWAMLLQLVAVTWYLTTGRGLFPTSGFGLDDHLVFPTIALMARPTAYVFRTTATVFGEIASRDYVRTAEAKGLGARLVLMRHIFPNARPTFFAGIAYASRSVLSSLAIVEYIFSWNGAGLAFIYAIANRNVDFAVALAICFATLFAIVNVTLAALSRNSAESGVAAAA